MYSKLVSKRATRAQNPLLVGEEVRKEVGKIGS
jgi:hypothetical protein